MKVTLVGINIDIENNTVSANSELGKDYTPESLCAAYARISRSSKDIKQLRTEADLDIKQARKSNEAIVFGMGHSSIAEHAVFSFDIEGVSRLAVEELESHRLCSFTEQSQRYVEVGKEYIVPPEFDTEEARDEFIAYINKQHAVYTELKEGIINNLNKEYDHFNRPIKDYENIPEMAKEDARYALSLAYTTQLGMTCNARNLELIIRRCRKHPLSEVRSLGESLYNSTKGVTPSLIKYTEGIERDSDLYTREYYRVKDLVGFKESTKDTESIVELLDSPTEASYTIALNTLFKESLEPLTVLGSLASVYKHKKHFVSKFFEGTESFSTMPREFEHVHYTFGVLVSASCYAQLKRHRMCTITAQGYNPYLQTAFIENIDNDPSLVAKLCELETEATGYWERVHAKRGSHIAEYVLLNSHKRRVIVTMNLRELYHFCRLRQDKHAQAEIRLLADVMVDQVLEVSPVAGLMLCGKDRFSEVYKKVVEGTE